MPSPPQPRRKRDKVREALAAIAAGLAVGLMMTALAAGIAAMFNLRVYFALNYYIRTHRWFQSCGRFLVLGMSWTLIGALIGTIDVASLVDRTPHTCAADAPMSMVFWLFSKLQLRCVVVIALDGTAAGLLERVHLMKLSVTHLERLARCGINQ